ncbi:DnaJ-domain-containing protein [Hypomontagnella monticulosa]|nr:DnaJ-domain-containing protein [Hypomontagnella monticulosa]
MNSFDPSAPTNRDYYADLELTQQASPRDIKLAFHKLARKHHPDKKAPGQSIDAHEFRKVREAYECLSDKDRRAKYDRIYFDLQDQWTRYRERQDRQRRHEERKRAEEELRAAWERAEEERRAAKAERARRMEEEIRIAREKAERERMRKEKARQAEERSREAANRARERQEQAARERLRQEKQREADRRSEAAAEKIRIEQEQLAQERLKSILIEEKQIAARHNWAKMRQAADHRATSKRQEANSPRPTPSRSLECTHPRYGWPRKNGQANCLFCGITRKKWSFCCPDCRASACPDCKATYCIF